VPLDKLSKAVITLERTTLVVFSSLGRRDMPLVSVATVSLAVRTTLCSKISRVVLFVEKISSACIKEWVNNNLPQKFSNASSVLCRDVTLPRLDVNGCLCKAYPQSYVTLEYSNGRATRSQAHSDAFFTLTLCIFHHALITSTSSYNTAPN